MQCDKRKKGIARGDLQLIAAVFKAAFIYEKTPGNSAWTYAHELGRLYLEQTFPEELSTVCYEKI